MNDDRVEAVTEALARLGYEGITGFDRSSPEYTALETLHEVTGSPAHCDLLAIGAGTVYYAVNGDRNRYWREYVETVKTDGATESVMDVKQRLAAFLECPVNTHRTQEKRRRLVQLFHHEFGDWFIEHHEGVAAIRVWEELAAALETSMDTRSVVLAMTIFDIAHLLRKDAYRAFPRVIDIPCDGPVARVARTAGLTTSTDRDAVRAAWAAVMDRVSDRLHRHVSLLRTDSIMWPVGKLLEKYDGARTVAQDAIFDHFRYVGLDDDDARALMLELTRTL